MAILKHIKLPATKRGIKRKHQPNNNNNAVNNKKIKPAAYDHDAEEDRLTNLPEPLKLHILSLLTPKQTVQTSALSKSWVSLWTSTPVLNFYSSFFGTTNLSDFDKTVTKILSSRDKSVNLDKLTFNRGGSSSAMVLKTVFGYALSNGVKEVKSWIDKSRNGSWPDCFHNTSSDSLTRLKLQSSTKISCEFLGQTSLFKNLKNLYLRKAIIEHPDPFSGFPALEKLTLYYCCYEDDYTLNIRASQLSVLTIKCYHSFKCCELSTPKLRIFKFDGCSTFPVFVTPQPLPLLDVVVVEFCGSFDDPKVEKQSFENLVGMFSSVHNIKSLTVSMSIVELLSGFQEELVKRCSPFRGLKFLKYDRGGIPDDVKDYLLQYSVDAKISMVQNNYIY